jgi:hypothetical protein
VCLFFYASSQVTLAVFDIGRLGGADFDFGACLGKFLEGARRQHNIEIIKISISSRSVVVGFRGHHGSSHGMLQQRAVPLAKMMQV